MGKYVIKGGVFHREGKIYRVGETIDLEPDEVEKYGYNVTPAKASAASASPTPPPKPVEPERPQFGQASSSGRSLGGDKGK